MTALATMPDAALAARYAPCLMLDRAEPYRPFAFGYTVFRTPAASPSSKFSVEPKGSLTLEYAIYYDWDIAHLYDLEHVWVHLDEAGSVIAVEASAHGGRLLMDADAGMPDMLGDRPILYVEAGKHAHWAAPEHVGSTERQRLSALCGPMAGIEGVHLGNLFAAVGAWSPTAGDHRLARLKLRQDAFAPLFDYVPLYDSPTLLPWPELAAAVPGRVASELARLPTCIRHFGAIFLDCGDTLIDERTEMKLPGSEVVTSAELIPGAREMLDALRAAGHKLILVADGPRQTFVNMLTHHGLWDHFDAHIISEDVGVHKPDMRMFDAALAAAGLTRADAWRTVMVGNNLSRDISGANAMGITSVFMAWSTLRTHVPACAEEVPHYRIASPGQLPALLDQLESLLPYRMPPPS